MLYKATRPDGTDFCTGTLNYAAACGSGKPVTWELPSWQPRGRMLKDQPHTYLSLSSEPGEVLTGSSWPCRLFEAEPVGRTIGHSTMSFKVCCRQVLIVAELPAHLALGPNGEAVAALIDRAGRLTPAEARDLAAAWSAARSAARDAARAAARDAAWALLVRDLITPAQFDVLYGPWAAVTGAAA